MLNPYTQREFETASQVGDFNYVADKYLNVSLSGQVSPKAKNCIDLDIDSKKIRDEIVDLHKNLIFNDKATFLNYAQESVMKKFNDFNCTNKIEKERQIESAKLITKASIEQEKKVLTSSSNEQTIYIILGGTVLLVALYIITKNK
jgi:hypothetical protein